MRRTTWLRLASAMLLLGAAACSNDPGSGLGFDNQADNKARPPAVSDAERALAGTNSAPTSGEHRRVDAGLANALDPVGDAVQTGVEQTGDGVAAVTGASEVGTGAVDRDHAQTSGAENSEATVDEPTRR